MASAVIDLSRADEPAVAPPSGQIDLSGADEPVTAAPIGQIDLSGADEPAPRRPSNAAIDLTDESSSVDKTRAFGNVRAGAPARGYAPNHPAHGVG